MRVSLSRKIVTGLVAVVMLASVVSFTSFGSRAMDRFHARFVELTLQQQHVSGRGLLFQQAIEIGKDHPLFGSGLGGFTSLTNQIYPHNIFLETFSEGGSFGLFLLCLTLLLFVALLWQYRYFLDPFSIGAFVIFFLFSQFSGSLFDARGAFMFMAICALQASVVVYEEPRLPRNLY